MASKAATEAVKANTRTQLRLIALPLCKKPELIYYYAHKRQIKGKEPANNEDSAGSDVEPVNQPERSKVAVWISKATNKATEQWEKLGNAPKGNWKHKIYMTGEKMMDRIEYEEWLLKALDASTAPKIPTRRRKEEEKLPLDEDHTVVPLYYPPSLVSAQHLEQNLKAMLEHRAPHHDKLMKRSFLLMPVTIPFGLLPVVPNLPFFYICWRAWSHWRALKSSQYLSGILDRGQVHTEKSKILEELYSRRSSEQSHLSAANKDDPSSPAQELPQILLTPAMVEEVVKHFELGEQASNDLRRAIHQTAARLKHETVEMVPKKPQT